MVICDRSNLCNVKACGCNYPHEYKDHYCKPMECCYAERLVQCIEIKNTKEWDN